MFHERIATSSTPSNPLAANPESGRTMARTGLRMMPTFPSSPLRFRTAGFPRYGSKAGFSDGAFPRGLHPSFAASVARFYPRSGSRLRSSGRRRHASGMAALPQRPSLRSGLCCPGPSSLIRPHPSHWPTRDNFPALRVICPAFAVLACCQPRQSTSGSELSLHVPSQHVALFFPGESRAGTFPALQRRVSPSPTSPLGSALSLFHFNPLHVALIFGVFWFAHSLQPAELLASPGGPDRGPVLVVFRPPSCPSQPRLLLPSFRPSRSPFSPSGITTVAPGCFHWQVFHLLERQLASLHERASVRS